LEFGLRAFGPADKIKIIYTTCVVLSLKQIEVQHDCNGTGHMVVEAWFTFKKFHFRLNNNCSRATSEKFIDPIGEPEALPHMCNVRYMHFAFFNDSKAELTNVQVTLTCKRPW
jgi:hypothetical protein